MDRVSRGDNEAGEVRGWMEGDVRRWRQREGCGVE